MNLKKTLLAAATIFALGATTANAMPVGDMSPQIMYPHDPCVAGGPTAADNAAAARLNNVLTGKLKNAMTGYRVSCARIVLDTVRDNGLGQRAEVIAITTTIVESLLENINEELDHDSLGLFQQRAHYGTRAQRLNPVWSTNAFLDEMQRVHPDDSWRTKPIGEVCQDTQRSAHPDRYQHEVADAQRIVAELTSAPIPKTVSIYGTLADGRMTYSTINSANGNRTKTLVSTDKLGFTPKAMATLNFNTVLVTSTSGVLHRVDIVTNNNSLHFNPPVVINGGWTHDMLTYDGYGHLYGIAGSTLMSYVVSRPKPSSVHIGQRAVIDSGFTMRTLTATGDDWLLGVSTTGVLRSYRINANNTWTGATLGEKWAGIDQIVSPGGSLYYGQTREGGMYWYLDQNPYDLNGSDLVGHSSDPVDPGGWTQTMLSAQPFSPAT
ncbi:tachylectin-related carbohydrate-binding protein [Kibdelosporangium aridum]|uniref:Tachylectin 2 domain-containing protein n=1 Tax=Kibdelosporangium aridum TaxID=2030 RepID=A0A1Y5Y0X6_KIBAR|nr:tachylectin-related carbohydrate-binding protein [Kibdelosporangium aridum]SMD23476.1 hypothetical protein SAMN05661093_08004 [Kibdelosporangium aridum]